MTPHEALSDMVNICELLDRHSLVININAAAIQRAGKRSTVTFKSAQGFDFEIQKDFTTIGEYRRFVDAGLYLVMLADGSLIQASYTFVRDTLTRHRLGYYPCPVQATREDFDAGESHLDTVDKLLLGQKSILLRSPLRFDYSGRDAAPGHPASHLTFNFPSCRIAVSAPLSFGHFVRLFFQHFYNKTWRDHEWLRATTVRRLGRVLTQVEEIDPHIHLGLGKDADLLEEADT